MARQRKRRIRTAHPGVKLKRMKRTTSETWVARFIDPDTGRETQTSLTALGKTDEESRRAWAIEKSQNLRGRKAALESGAPLRTETPVAKAIADYYDPEKTELSPASVLSYKQATDPFAAWCGSHGVYLTESLNGPLLTAYRLWFVVRPAHAPMTGKRVGRGTFKAGKRKRSAAQINKCIRTLRVVLNHWRKEGITPGLTSDVIRDNLEFAKSQRPLPHFLKAKEARALLEAAMRHDADTFTFVRRGEARQDESELAHHYEPVAPFITVGLLAGMRFAELANLRWRDVDLDAGVITLGADATKTKHARRITLAETPALAALLAAMKLRAGENRFVWGPEAYRRDVAESARKRLVKDYAAPEFSWHDLRRTCGTFLTCAPSIYGAASAFLSAKRLGHSVLVSERHYAGAATISPEHRTLEAALTIADLCAKMAVESDLTERPALKLTA